MSLAKAIVTLPANARGALRLAFFLKVGRERFVLGADQAAILLLLYLGLGAAYDWLATEPERVFDAYGLSYHVTTLFISVAGTFVIARLLGAAATFGELLCLGLLAGLVPSALMVPLALLGPDLTDATSSIILGGAGLAAIVWFVLIGVRSARLLYGVGWRHAALVVVAVDAVAYGAIWAVPETSLWYTAYAVDESYADDIDVEATYYDQSRLLRSHAMALAPQRPGIPDIYFLGFAGDAAQDVFLSEVRGARAVMDERFGTGGRSMLLVNNAATVRTNPIANRRNLVAALGAIADRMDKDEDILFLFLTSHGSPDELSVDFWPLPLVNLTAADLRRGLDASGIKWRVVVISACYSGSFVDDLAEPKTLVITAAADNALSHGCSDDRSFTEFGEAYFERALRETTSFVAAFQAARAAIEDREKADGVTHSRPMIALGEAMAGKLADVELSLAAKD
ncbi:MAG: C13 family peptidase [Alphaproteobacteria bacterium]